MLGTCASVYEIKTSITVFLDIVPVPVTMAIIELVPSYNKDNIGIGVVGLRFKLHGNNYGNHGKHYGNLYGNYHDNHGNHLGNHVL